MCSSLNIYRTYDSTYCYQNKSHHIGMIHDCTKYINIVISYVATYAMKTLVFRNVNRYQVVDLYMRGLFVRIKQLMIFMGNYHYK